MSGRLPLFYFLDTCHFTGFERSCWNPYFFGFAVNKNAHFLKICPPFAFACVHRVGTLVAKWGFSACNNTSARHPVSLLTSQTPQWFSCLIWFIVSNMNESIRIRSSMRQAIKDTLIIYHINEWNAIATGMFQEIFLDIYYERMFLL